VGRVRWWLSTEKQAEGKDSENVEISAKAGVAPLPPELTDVSCSYDPVFTKEGNEMRSIECTGTGWRALTIAICSTTYQPAGARVQEPADGAASIRDVAVLLAQENGHPFRVGLICATQPAEASTAE